MTRRIGRLIAERNILNDEIEELVLELVRLEVSEERQRQATDEGRSFKKGAIVTIMTGDLKNHTAVLLRKVRTDEIEGENRWEFRVVGGPQHGRMTWRKQKNLVVVPAEQDV